MSKFEMVYAGNDPRVGHDVFFGDLGPNKRSLLGTSPELSEFELSNIQITDSSLDRGSQ